MYLKNPNENLLQGVKHVRIQKFIERVSKKDFKKSLNGKKVEHGKKNKFMDSLLEICLKAQTKKRHGSGRENVN